jgi:tRNA-intron endonuclease, archaea type
MAKIKANLISENVVSNSIEAQNLFATRRFGEKLDEKIIYSLPETLFLIKEKQMELFDHKDRKLNQDEIIKRFQKIDKKFKTKYIVFKDLRKKGYIVKPALKFGAEFRVYDKGKSVGKDHSKWLLFSVSETSSMTWQEFSAKNRIAHSTKKDLLIAVVDEEADVSYYEAKWIQP